MWNFSLKGRVVNIDGKKLKIEEQLIEVLDEQLGQRSVLVKARNIENNILSLVRMHYQLNPEDFSFSADENKEFIEIAKMRLNHCRLVQQHPSYLNYDVRTNKLYLVELAGLSFTDLSHKKSFPIDEESPYVEAFNIWRAPYQKPEESSAKAGKTPVSDKKKENRPPWGH